MPNPESFSPPPPHQEARINDPEALITAPTQDTADILKSDAIEFGVNNFVELPQGLEAITKDYENADKSSKEKKTSALKKAIAAMTAFLALVPAGLVKSTSTEHHTARETQISTTTTTHTVEKPIDHTSTIQSYDWDKSDARQDSAEQAADDIEQAIEHTEQEARDMVPAGATVTSIETSADMHIEGGADDSHRVSPSSDNKNLGQQDAYNDQLANDRAEQVEKPLSQELENKGVKIDRSTTDGKEHVLTPEQIEAGGQLAERYGYNDFDELIQAHEHGRVSFDTKDQVLYDEMITDARNTTVDVDGNVTVTYETTTITTEQVPVKGISEHEDIIGVPNAFAAIATEERAGRSSGRVRHIPSRDNIPTSSRTPISGPTNRSYGPQVRGAISKQERRGVTAQRSFGGSSVRKLNGATYSGSRHAGAFLTNSR